MLGSVDSAPSSALRRATALDLPGRSEPSAQRVGFSEARGDEQAADTGSHQLDGYFSATRIGGSHREDAAREVSLALPRTVASSRWREERVSSRDDEEVSCA
jgi:hypothetical protein